MELQSTVSFKEIDIDKMLEQTTLDDFLRGLYVNNVGLQVDGQKKQTQHEKMMGMIGDQGKEDTERNAPALSFDDEIESENKFSNENLRK